MEAEGIYLKIHCHEVADSTPNVFESNEWAVHLHGVGFRHIVWAPHKVFEHAHLAFSFRLHSKSCVL